jgi:hypothetical protein
MFEKLFDYQSVQARHRNAPFAQERAAYLSHRVLRNELIRGDESVPSVPDPGERLQLIPENPAL